MARQLGGVNLLNEQQVADLIKIRERMGLRGPTPACDWTPGVSQIQPAANGGGIPTLKTKSAGATTPAPNSGANGSSQPDLVDEITRRVMQELQQRS